MPVARARQELLEYVPLSKHRFERKEPLAKANLLERLPFLPAARD